MSSSNAMVTTFASDSPHWSSYISHLTFCVRGVKNKEEKLGSVVRRKIMGVFPVPNSNSTLQYVHHILLWFFFGEQTVS